MKSMLRMSVLVAAVAIGAAGGSAAVSLWNTSWTRTSVAQERVALIRQNLARAADFSEAFKLTAQAVRPSVVSISSVKKAKVDMRLRQRPGARPVMPGIPDELRRFFGDDSLERMFPQVPEGYGQEGLGSGVIVSADGFILTNNHVVSGADEVTVTFADGKQLKAKIVGADKQTDIAVVKVDAQGLPAAVLGDSDAVAVGEWVLAVGSPLGFDQTVTSGIISAKGRQVGVTNGGYEDFLQTDCAINPGNSGGPLVNLRGEVIGINTAIASRSGGFSGIGFAIPVNMVQSIMTQIRSTGKVTRGRIGAAIQDLTEDLAKSFGYDGREGALVGDVVPNSPAAKAGIQAGDIIVKYQGKPVKTSSQLRNAVAATLPETAAELEVIRDGKPRTVKVQVGALSEADLAANAVEEAGAETTESLGVAVQPLTPELANQRGLKDLNSGMLVTGVQPGSIGEKAGLREGDIVVSVGAQAIKTVDEFRKELTPQSLAAGVRLQIVRDGVTRFLFVRVNG